MCEDPLWSGFSGDGEGLRLRRFEIVLGFVIGEVFEIVDDGNVEGAARAAGHLFAESELVFGDLEEVAAGAWEREGLELLAPFHVLDLHVVVRHRFALIISQSRRRMGSWEAQGVVVVEVRGFDSALRAYSSQ